MSEAEVIERPEGETDEQRQQADARRQEIETQARRQGWRPKEEYTGTGAWVDAEEFVERGKQFSTILRQENSELKRKLDEMERRQEESGKVFQEFRSFHERSVQQAYAKARRDLEAQRDAAVGTGNVDEFRRAQASIDELDKEKPAAAAADTRRPPDGAAAPQQHQVDPYVQQWVGENAWFNSDPDAQAYAKAVNARLDKEQPGITLRENLAETRRLVAKRFPELFGNPRRDTASSVAAPANNGGRQPKKGPSYDDLPADAKKQCDKFVGQKLLTKEQYIADYFAQG